MSATSKGKARLTLYSRAYCHLCQDMLAALEDLRGEFSFVVDVRDVDADPLLTARYDELVPVLEGDGIELCRYRLDGPVVSRYLKSLI